MSARLGICSKKECRPLSSMRVSTFRVWPRNNVSSDGDDDDESGSSTLLSTLVAALFLVCSFARFWRQIASPRNVRFTGIILQTCSLSQDKFYPYLRAGANWTRLDGVSTLFQGSVDPITTMPTSVRKSAGRICIESASPENRRSGLTWPSR